MRALGWLAVWALFLVPLALVALLVILAGALLSLPALFFAEVLHAARRRRP